MAEKITGGCMCGAVRYSITAVPKYSLICQCRDCQHITGAGHSAQFAVMVDETTLKGPIKYYEMQAHSGHAVQSGFCEHCGNPVFKKTAQFPELLYFHAATLDKPENFVPEFSVYESSAQPWDHIDPELPKM